MRCILSRRRDDRYSANGMSTRAYPAATDETTSGLPARVHRGILIVLQVTMAVELILVFSGRQWVNAFLIMTIMAVTLSPAVLGRRFRVHIPPEFQMLAVVFVFAALFLGEIHSYYVRFWWWDIALHTSSGLLKRDGVCDVPYRKLLEVPRP